MSKELVELLAAKGLLTRCGIILGLEALDPKGTFADIVELPKPVIDLAVAQDHQGLPECWDGKPSDN